MAIFKLAAANLRTRKIRMVLALAAIIFAVSLVVAVTSGYASLNASAQKFIATYMGVTDAQITRMGAMHGTVPQSISDQLKSDPDVAKVIVRLELDTQLPGSSVLAQLIGVRRPEDTQVESLRMVEGHWFETDRGDVAVIDQVAAEKLNVGLGGTFSIPGAREKLTVKVVGIVHKPSILAAAAQTIYLPLATMQQLALPGQPPQVTRILITLKSGRDLNQWAARWREKLEQIDPSLSLRLSRENREQMESNVEVLHILSYLGGAVSILAAGFIVLSTLTMGVAERQRTLAMLRAIGAFKWQIGLLVVSEGLILALIGAVLGTPLGWAWIKLLSIQFDHLFAAGVHIDVLGIVMGAGGVMIAALLGSFLPAWWAMRVDPLAAMSPLAAPAATRRRLPWRSALLGLLFAGIDPLLFHGPLDWLVRQSMVENPERIIRKTQFYGHFFAGVPGIMIGFFLVAPLLVWLAERFIGPLAASLFGIRFALLRQQLTGGIWRAAATCAALMVGLAILVVMQIQSNSLLNAWKLPDRFPDIFIFSIAGLNPQQQKELAQVPGIRPEELMPIAIALPELWKTIFSIGGTNAIPNATMFFGVDPDKALKMMELDFRDGNAADAARLLKQGRHLIVTDEYRQLKGLKVGDTLTLNTPKHGPVDYTICGVVWSPGIDLIVSRFDMGRQFDQRTTAAVFGTLKDARDDFGVTDARLFAANLEYHVEKEQLIENIQKKLGTLGLVVGDVREIKYNIQQNFNRIIRLASTMAFCAMVLAALGVANTLMAGIRTRRWQFGILRSIGVTRWQLLRLVMAEAFLMGLVACGMGVLCGFELTWGARGIGRNLLGFLPPIAIPWDIIGIGAAVVLGVALLASLWPAFSVARAKPLALLQSGRAAA
ncbi:MAG: ABC transporter permease [Phycisphaerales bacterium]|nr:ABC transporter permease [Phycisphaerales bacterium]